MSDKQLSLESLAIVVENQSKTILELQAQLLSKSAVQEAAKPPSIPTESVKVKGKEYKFNVPKFAFLGSDKQYLAEEVATDEAILKQILAIEGQGILRELV